MEARVQDPELTATPEAQRVMWLLVNTPEG
jgi:hypothetical protein